MLKTVEIDLDNNGFKEKIEIIETIDSGGDTSDGRIKIYDASGQKVIIFKEGASSLTGVMQDIMFEDLNGDGALDIFIVIPDLAGSYSANYFYIYNYRTGEQYSFNYGSSIDEAGKFISSLKLKYHSINEVEISSNIIKYSTVLKIQPSVVMSIPDDGKWYNNTSSAVPVAIENSGYVKNSSMEKYISSIHLEKQNNRIYIVVPYLLSGLHHEDIMAEIDIYFAVNSSFEPEKKYFKVYNVNQEGEFIKRFINTADF